MDKIRYNILCIARTDYEKNIINTETDINKLLKIEVFLITKYKINRQPLLNKILQIRSVKNKKINIKNQNYKLEECFESIDINQYHEGHITIDDVKNNGYTVTGTHVIKY